MVGGSDQLNNGVTEEAISQQSSPSAKIALFRSLFRGREDVYPLRFESRKTGRSGYQPACGNEWVRGLCEKPRIKCSECCQQAFLPVTDEVIRWHLTGEDDRGRFFVMGVYPMLRDETCFFLAVDFDNVGWQDDSIAFVKTCRECDVPVALERSRSGNGGHVWLFFEEAISATLARNLGCAILTRTMSSRPEIGLRSYDRLFPNQDTLPKGGFGNLIALPLQKAARDQGHSVFVDDLLNPHRDQWAYLSSIERISKSQSEKLSEGLAGNGGRIGVRLFLPDEDDDTPWTALPSRHRKELPIIEQLPKKLELVLGDQIYIQKNELVPPLLNRLIRLAAFQNPEFYKAQSMRLPTYGKPRVIGCAEDHAKHLALPCGCLEEVRALLRSLNIRPIVRDERCKGDELQVDFHGELRTEQEIAVKSLLAHDTGVLSAPPGFGKTVVGAALIANRGVNTLIVVHLRELLDQWVERLSSFLNVPTKSIGRIGGGRKKWTGKLDVALVQSLVRKGVVEDRVADYGHLIIDECHHLSAVGFEQVARRAKAKYVAGLSATVTRKDGHHPIIFMQCGPIRHRIDPRRQAAARPFVHNVIVRPTGFRSKVVDESDARIQFQSLYSELIADADRNELICADVVAAVRDGRFPVVLTERTEHLERLAEALEPRIKNVFILRGGLGKKRLNSERARLTRVPENEGSVLLATGRYLGEGFDEARLDTLFLTLPVSWRGTIAQYVGRLHRLHDGKREVRVYDYADLDVPMLSRMFDRRCRGYEAVGYSILLPASALPGWPSQVPLPIDPEWKKDYASSVRRLIQDGVDVPLGNLFVSAARSPPTEAEGVDRARSASEAFLFRRLESISQTAGRFALNQDLPIPFDGRGRMEVDFLCKEFRLAIEIDGDQHLGDPEAYRRDRCKDALLQEHTYFVLRFLAQDIGKRLEETLDVILRTLDHCERRTNAPSGRQLG